MGFISDLTGETAAKAARTAAEIQAQAQQEAIGEVREGAEKAREPLQPFATEGTDVIAGLSELITNPEAQRDFILDNPFFETLREQSQQDLFQTQAATGRLGSGETLEALQESYLLLGADLLNQNIGQRLNVASGLGLPAASGISGITERESGNVADLTVGIGESRAAGEVGAAKAVTEGAGRIVNTALAIRGLPQLNKPDTPAPVNLGG